MFYRFKHLYDIADRLDLNSEKRLLFDLQLLQQDYERHKKAKLLWILSTENYADSLTRNIANSILKNILKNNLLNLHLNSLIERPSNPAGKGCLQVHYVLENVEFQNSWQLQTVL